VIAGDDLAADRQAFLEPPSQAFDQRAPLILFRLQEVEEFPLAIEVGERRAAEQADEVVSVFCLVNALPPIATLFPYTTT